jgi:hypothetical protein
MKTITLTLTIGVLALLVTSCKKSSPTPTPTSSSSSSSTASVILTAQELLLIGDWSHDKNELYSSGVLVTTPGGTTYFNDSLVYHTKFDSTATTSPLDPTATAGTYKKGYDGTSAGDMLIYWRITPTGKLQIGSSLYSIDLLTSTHLIYYTGSLTSGSAIKYYLHKM